MQVEGPDFTQNLKIIKFKFYTYTYEEVSDLKPSTEYSFSVSAETVAGSGPAISVSFVTPQEGEASMHIMHVVCGGMFSVCLFSKEHA